MSKIRKTGHLLTEKVNPNTLDIDTYSSEQIIESIISEDKIILKAISDQKENISKAVEIIVDGLSNNGRLFFVGAGTSGRLGILEAAECPPTFGTEAEMIQGIIAGGNEAIIRSIEGAEDSKEESVEILKLKHLGKNDIVVGIAASSSTPFVKSALDFANRTGSKTVLITCNPVKDLIPDITIQLLVGPEVVVGSTRLKAGTATKIVLNMLTTSSMILLGKTYGNLMVDVQPKSSKLKDRAIRIVMELCEIERFSAQKALEDSEWNVKASVLMLKKDISFKEALNILDQNDGFLKKALY
ncbi:MAG: N-acetylmuramic acid 6-phosphate etherase [Thermodesulfobacteriota bacterium]